MKRKITLLLVCISLMFLVAGCSLFGGFSQPQVSLVQFPEYVTPDKVFTVKGEYLTKKPDEEKVRVILSVKETGDDARSIYTAETSFTNESQTFEFTDIMVDGFASSLYFELKLIVSGKVVTVIDTKDRATSTASWHTNIITTYFNPTTSDGSPALGTWNNDLTLENPFFFALPFRNFAYKVWNGSEYVYPDQDFVGEDQVKNRWIEVYYPTEDRTVYAQWVDVGPWNIYDPAYVFSTDDQRPYAEYGVDMGWHDKGHRLTNLAGLDLSPQAMKYLNAETQSGAPLVGKITVNWRFVEAAQVPDGPWKNRISTTAADVNALNLETQTLRTLE